MGEHCAVCLLPLGRNAERGTTPEGEPTHAKCRVMTDERRILGAIFRDVPGTPGQRGDVITRDLAREAGHAISLETASPGQFRWRCSCGMYGQVEPRSGQSAQKAAGMVHLHNVVVSTRVPLR